MLKELEETVKQLNSDVKTVANCEKAKQLKKKLLSIGLPLAVIGFLGVFICFVSFAMIGISSVDNFEFDSGFPKAILIPFFLIIPCAIIGGIGASISSIGFKIVVTSYTSDLIDEAIGNNCPFCKDPISEGELFCSKCGNPVRKKCPNCEHINDLKCDYCIKCGSKL